MDKEKIKNRLSAVKESLPEMRPMHAKISWKDGDGKDKELSLGPRAVGAFLGVFAVCVMALAVCSGLLVRAYEEQQELQNYRADYGIYTERLAKLMDNNEKLQRELSQVSKLEALVRDKLKKEGVAVSEQNVDAESQRLDQDGKGGPSTADALTVLEVQDEINWKKLAYKKENLSNMLLALSSSGDGTYAWPLDGGEISSFYGLRADPFGGGAENHAGVDIAAEFGTPVKASATGVVQQAAWNGGYGRFVSIDHGDGMTTCYGHMSAIAVAPGQRVTRGQVIGYVGSSGYSTGPHLHFEMREGGSTVNPLQFTAPTRTSH
jgi:murein DD-endopeptidase MepM/ murein hydrolase activator NlpD